MMINKVAAALEQAFKDRVAASAGQPFEATGVTVPGFDVWEAYARAAVSAMQTPTADMTDAGIKAWDDYNHVFEVWREMAIEALK